VICLRRGFRPPLNPKSLKPKASNWVKGLDLNQRPSGYEPSLILGIVNESEPNSGFIGGQTAGRVGQVMFECAYIEQSNKTLIITHTS